MTSKIELCLKQIDDLSKKYDLVIEQNNELHACNQQLLRQHEAHKTELIIIKESFKLNGLKVMTIKPKTVNSTFSKYPTKSLIGISPIKKISDQLEQELRT
ncbi:MAG: hypothetical protein JKY50_07280 [Oleispira sp.]|nr:hypothetical protein [Oleispira sp.]MBL4881197.1 hypothetical protein [Oleispira sp.]